VKKVVQRNRALGDLSSTTKRYGLCPPHITLGRAPRNKVLHASSGSDFGHICQLLPNADMRDMWQVSQSHSEVQIYSEVMSKEEMIRMDEVA
jgi:hypothetical protein